jgi:hypothetical protein
MDKTTNTELKWIDRKNNEAMLLLDGEHTSRTLHMVANIKTDIALFYEAKGDEDNARRYMNAARKYLLRGYEVADASVGV